MSENHLQVDCSIGYLTTKSDIAMSNNNVLTESKEALLQLVDTINQLTYDEFVEPLSLLSGSTIGQHTRHIIELYQQLLNGYANSVIDYDNRERNISIQNNIDTAVQAIAEIISTIEREDKPLRISTLYSNNEDGIDSNYYRELMYNIEHCIHHCAIIRIGLIELKKIIEDDNFGVAKSTLVYRKQCVQ
jgi:uncharacterized damage-inducible protein DinB